MKIFWYFFLLLLSSQSTKNNASCVCPTKPLLNLDALLKDVVERNPNLAATRPRIDAARLKVDRVQFWPDPRFMFMSMDHPIGKQCEFSPERWFTFSQRFPIPGKLRLRGEVVEQQLEFFKSEELRTHWDLIVQTKMLYYQLYFNKIAHDINTHNRTIITRLIDGTLAAYKTGKGIQADVHKAHIELQLLDDELLRLDSEQAMIIAMINALLDRPQQEPVGIPEETITDPMQLSYEELEELAMQQRPELHGL